MLIKKFNSFILYVGILIGSVCQNVSGTQNALENKSDCIVETETQKGKEFYRKIVDLGKKFKNKLKEVKDYIPKKIYATILTAFGIKLMSEILKHGVNQYCFNEENKTPEVNIRPEVKKATPENSTLVAQKEENKSNFSKSSIDNRGKNKDQSNDLIVTPSSQNTNSPNDVESTKKITENTSVDSSKDLDAKTAGNVPNSSENLNGTLETSRKNSSSHPEGLTTKTSGEEPAHHSSKDVDIRVETDELGGDLKPIFLVVYSDFLLYLLISLTPKEWGLQKAWYDFRHNNTFEDSLTRLFGAILFVRLIINVCMIFLCFSEEKTNIFWEINPLIKYIFLFISCFSPSFNSVSGAVTSFNNVPEYIKEKDKKEENKRIKYRILRALIGFFLGYNVETYFFYL